MKALEKGLKRRLETGSHQVSYIVWVDLSLLLLGLYSLRGHTLCMGCAIYQEHLKDIFVCFWLVHFLLPSFLLLLFFSELNYILLNNIFQSRIDLILQYACQVYFILPSYTQGIEILKGTNLSKFTQLKWQSWAVNPLLTLGFMLFSLGLFILGQIKFYLKNK